MPKQYSHLSKHDRDIIAVLRSQGASLRSIARQLQRNPSTISRELQRNVPPLHQGYYLPHKAHARTLIPHLTRAHHKRLPRGHSRKHRKPPIPGRVPLVQRPVSSVLRRQAGHWEIDTAVSRQGPATLNYNACHVALPVPCASP